MKRLRKELGLFDVFAISTGAMFSSGFFLLPGLAAAKTGPSVVVAYLLSAGLAVPAMLSLAELCTAMPRAGGPYYFLDRSLGPLVGTVGGFGTWLALVFKTAFALIGVGAYLSIFVELPVKPVAIAFALVFAALNVAGAKETTGVQRVLVLMLLAILVLFIAQGLAAVLGEPAAGSGGRAAMPFLTHGVEGLFATVGLVFVSFAGLMKVASVPEEVRDPDRNIPLGMFLSLATVGVVYGLAISIMVAVLDPAEFYADLTPVATAGVAVMRWLPEPLGKVLVVTAALAAFGAVSNAGIMSASRYPLAMARDRLLSPRLAGVGRFGTPVPAIAVTVATMVFFLVVLDVEGVAKLASAFLLLVFGLVNLAVVVMRESEIESYAPGFRSPLYPWVQIVGFFVPLLLIIEMGWMPILFTLGVTAASIAWFVTYARPRVVRDGAMFHVFERLGRRRFAGLDPELRQIMKEKGLREEDPFDEVVARASVIDQEGEVPFEELAQRAADLLARLVPATREELARRFLEGTRLGITPVSHGVALPHLRMAGVATPHLVLARSRSGVPVRVGGRGAEAPQGAGVGERAEEPIRAVFFLVSPERNPRQHLRILAQLAGRADDEEFMDAWLRAENETELREVILRDDRFLSLRLAPGTPAAALAGRSLREAGMPAGTLVALVARGGETLVPGGNTVLEEGDRLTVVGTPEGIRELARRYVDGRSGEGRSARERRRARSS